MIEEGKKAPAFSLLGSDSKKHTLESYVGKYIVLYFYPKDDTPGCTKEACGFKELTKQFSSLNTVVLGVSKDSLESHNNFISKFRLPFVLLSDPDGKMMEKYGAWGEKNMYGKKTKGVIRSTVVIDSSGKVIKHWRRVSKAETHPEQVLKFLNECGC